MTPAVPGPELSHGRDVADAPAVTWLRHVTSALPELDAAWWTRLEGFEVALRAALDLAAADLVVRDEPAPTRRARALLSLRAHLVLGDSTAATALADAAVRAPIPAPRAATLLDPAHQPRSGPASALEANLGTGRGARLDEIAHDELAQTTRQLVAGYYDLDLRDVSGPGHGRMILRHGSPRVRAHWAPRLAHGELAGIAVTEPHGGSQTHRLRTELDVAGDSWTLTGDKIHISRLHEASVFVVFARVAPNEPATPTESGAAPMVAVVVDAARPELEREQTPPAGLSGWSWGTLRLRQVPVEPTDLLLGHQPAAHPQLPRGADASAVFAHHFAHYRQLVTATALGAAAAVHDTVAAHLSGRLARGEIDRVGDHALIALGAAHADLTAALLAVLHTQRLAAHDHPDAVTLSAAIKAHGVDTARRATDHLLGLTGAAGFGRDHPLQKTRRDLDALRYADGIHDSLQRAAGIALLRHHVPDLRKDPR